MTGFRLPVPKHRAVGASLLLDTRCELMGLLLNGKREHGMSQSKIARRLNEERSVIHGQLIGTANLSLMRVGEIASILGYVPQITFVKETPDSPKKEKAP